MPFAMPQMQIPNTMRPLAAMAGHFGIPLSQKSVQPFIDMEKDRNRAQVARMFAGPLGAAATHLAPVVPSSVHGIAGAGALPLSTAIPQMLGMANPAISGAAGGLAGTVMGHLAPVLAMGALGAGGAVLGTYGVSKLVSGLLRRRRAKQLAKQQQNWYSQLGLPKFSAILDPEKEQGAEMFSDVRFAKFAAEGALGYSAPSSLKEAIRKVAFTAGLLRSTMADHEVNEDEALVLRNLVTATKMAKDLTRELRNRLRVKLASHGYDHSLKAIATECFSGLIKSANAPKQVDGLGAAFFNEHNKAAAALDLLGVDETTFRSLTGGKQSSGFAAGVLGLLAA